MFASSQSYELYLVILEDNLVCGNLANGRHMIGIKGIAGHKMTVIQKINSMEELEQLIDEYNIDIELMYGDEENKLFEYIPLVINKKKHNLPQID